MGSGYKKSFEVPFGPLKLVIFVAWTVFNQLGHFIPQAHSLVEYRITLKGRDINQPPPNSFEYYTSLHSDISSSFLVSTIPSTNMPHAETPEPTISGVPLFVNDGLLSPSEVLPLRVSHPSEPLDTLRARFDADGHLLLRGLLPRDDVQRARKAYFDALAHTGVLKPDTPAVEGRFDDAKPASDFPGLGAGQDTAGANGRPGSSETAAAFIDAAFEQHTAPWYWSEDGTGFAQHPVLRRFVEEFTGWGGERTAPVKRTLLRNNTPGNKAIGVHYDQTFMRYGEPTSVTAWVPIGDVSLEGGGLIYLEDGERLGAEIEDEFSRKAREAGMTEEEMRYAFNANMLATGFLCDGPKEFGRKYGKRWFVGPYEAGDVVLHKAHAVSALVCVDTGVSQGQHRKYGFMS